MVKLRPSCVSSRYTRATLAGRSLRGLPHRAHVRAAVGGGPAPLTDQSAEAAKLTQSIVEAESRLAVLFEPGKPMPRAGVVAAMRQEVSELKAQLAALVSGGAGAEAVMDSALATDDELAERARQAFLEVERLLGQKNGSARSRQDEAAIALLEAENERLRIEAMALLLREQQLEELVAAKLPKAGNPTW
ncbi:hypothetical protein Agub_g703, partial [Astrephomene gubernaculifera]